MKWLGRWLCRLGFHKWEYLYPEINRELARNFPYKTVCMRCGKGI